MITYGGLFSLILLVLYLVSQMLPGFVEWLAGISPILIVIIAAIALKQISIAKDDIKIRSTREAVTLTVDQMRFYAEVVVPEMIKYVTNFNKLSISKTNYQLNNYFFEEIKLDPQKLKQFSELHKLLITNLDLDTELVSIANRLESIAFAFMSGAADETGAFPSLSRTFCRFVEENWFHYCNHRRQDRINIYDNTIKLYGIWSNRIKQFDLSVKSKDITKELGELDTKKVIPLGSQ